MDTESSHSSLGLRFTVFNTPSRRSHTLGAEDPLWTIVVATALKVKAVQSRTSVRRSILRQGSSVVHGFSNPSFKLSQVSVSNVAQERRSWSNALWGLRWDNAQVGSSKYVPLLCRCKDETRVRVMSRTAVNVPRYILSQLDSRH